MESGSVTDSDHDRPLSVLGGQLTLSRRPIVVRSRSGSLSFLRLSWMEILMVMGVSGVTAAVLPPLVAVVAIVSWRGESRREPQFQTRGERREGSW